MLKTAIYVDAENIKMSGGYGMRYDVLVGLAQGKNSTMLRANCYLAEDHDRIKADYEYRQKVYTYHDILRQCGFKIIKKYVRRFKDEEGNITTKANADMDLAIDALHQVSKLDRIILVTGDGDFLRLVVALQNTGCRVEVIGFHNVNKELRESADSFISGFLIPGLLPIAGTNNSGPGENNERWQRGVIASFYAERGFGFFRYYRLVDATLYPETVFFHLSKATIPDHYFLDHYRIFEFRIVENPSNDNRSEAWDIRLIKES